MSLSTSASSTQRLIRSDDLADCELANCDIRDDFSALGSLIGLLLSQSSHFDTSNGGAVIGESFATRLGSVSRTRDVLDVSDRSTPWSVLC